MNTERPGIQSSVGSETVPPGPASPPNWKRRRWWYWALATIAIVCGLFQACHSSGQPADAKGGAAGARAVPVVALPSRTGDLGVYQTGLGTVTPLKTVTVRSRVDGQLLSVGYHEGQVVHEGDLLAQIDPRPFEVQLHEAQGQLAKDEAALENAQVDLERYKVLVEQDSIARQQLDAQAATVRQNQATLKSDQAQVESANLNLTYSRITAPISGVVGLRLVDPGNMVHAADPAGLLVITQEQPIATLFTIPADRLPAVLRQTKAGRTLTVEAWDRNLTHKLATGSLSAIDNQIDQATGTVRIKALFPNQDAALYPNQFVNARLLVDTLRNVVLIPTAALEQSPKSTYVYVVKPDSTVETREVAVQLTAGDDTALSHGIAAGEMVVVDGMDKLQSGMKVTLAGANEGRKPSR